MLFLPPLFHRTFDTTLFEIEEHLKPVSNLGLWLRIAIFLVRIHTKLQYSVTLALSLYAGFQLSNAFFQLCILSDN